MTRGGVILTGGSIHPMLVGGTTTAEAVRLDGRRITHVGSLGDARSLGDAEIVDLDGGCLMPGFVDAHTHPLMHGQCRSWADVSMASSVDEVLKLLGEHARVEARTGTIRGFGYDHHRLAEGRHPTAAELDRVADDRTVMVMHVSGHGFSVNSHGLAEAGITADTRTPTGGLIGFDTSGRPDGRVFDSACDLLTGVGGVKVGNHGPNLHVPDHPDDLAAMLDAAQEDFLAAGITSVGDCQVTGREMRAFLVARDTGRLRLRVTMYVLSSHVESLRHLGLDSTLGDDLLAFGGVKHYADGALTGGTAYLPCGCGTTHGYLYHEAGRLEDLLAASAAAGLQTATHAQGPDAIQLVLDALDRLPPNPGLRHRIEHCGFPTDEQLKAMRRLGVVPVPQPTQVHLFGEGVRHDHPELADRMYPSGLIADAGLPVVLSSDAPVTNPDVMLACWAAETRMTAAGRVLGGAFRISRRQAFEGYTRGGAHALRRDDVGSLAPGRLADLAILDADPFTVATNSLPDVSVIGTWVGGRPVWTTETGVIDVGLDQA